MKKILMVIMCIAVVAIFSNSILVIGASFKPSDPGYNQNLVPGATNATGISIWATAKSVWATIAVIVQFICVGCMVFAGLRYMFASADQKADIKQGLIYLALGAFIVFGAISIIQLVSGSANSIIVK